MLILVYGLLLTVRTDDDTSDIRDVPLYDGSYELSFLPLKLIPAIVNLIEKLWVHFPSIKDILILCTRASAQGAYLKYLIIFVED